MSRRTSPLALPSLLALAVGAAVASSGGCSERACIEWSSAQGACPSAAEALTRMTPTCGGPVVSVDSLGDFDGEHCCYDVTELDDSDEFAAEPGFCSTASTAIASVSSASSSSSSSASVSSSSSVSSSGVGGHGGDGGGGMGGVAGNGGAGGEVSETGCEISGKPCQPTCAPPAVPPSNGNCVTIGGIVQCNPLTNQNCVPGTTCDSFEGGYACRPMAAPPTDICQSCESKDACGANMTCFGSCFRFCCNQSDCGTGKCYKDPLPGSLLTAVGVCVEAE